MKQILECYGKFLLEGVSLFLLLILLMCNVTDGKGNTGVFEVIGGYLQTEDTSSYDGEDFKAYELECIRTAPVIAYTSGETLYTGSHILENYFQAFDSEGKQIPVRVLSVINPCGEIIAKHRDTDVLQIELAAPGIYQIKIAAADERNKRTMCTIKIPVNKR